ncbi:hypothetical protein Tco_0778872 [Tanacetum coccineum]
MHNNLMAAGSKGDSTPLCCATGAILSTMAVSRFLTRYCVTTLDQMVMPFQYIIKKDTPAVPAQQRTFHQVPEQTNSPRQFMNMTPENRAHFESGKKMSGFHLILTGIGDEIYSNCWMHQKKKKKQLSLLHTIRNEDDDMNMIKNNLTVLRWKCQCSIFLSTTSQPEWSQDLSTIVKAKQHKLDEVSYHNALLTSETNTKRMVPIMQTQGPDAEPLNRFDDVRSKSCSETVLANDTSGLVPLTAKDLSGEPIDQTDYHSKIRSLMYLTSSRPDIVEASAGYVALSASCAQVMYCKLCSKKQNCTTMSSAEAEYVALSASFSHSNIMKPNTRYHFIKEQVENGIIELYFVRTEYQLADMFTKALPEEKFQYLVRRIGMRCLTPAELEVLTNESA